MIEAKDLLIRALAGEPMDLKASLQQPLRVPESMPALKVLKSFKQSGTDIALVVGESGKLKGLLTHHDILEVIVGDIPSDADGTRVDKVLVTDSDKASASSDQRGN